MITIRRERTSEGYCYAVADLDAYAQELEQHGIEPPRACYRVHVPSDIDDLYRRTRGDLDEQLLRFFSIDPAAGIEARIVDASHADAVPATTKG